MKVFIQQIGPEGMELNETFPAEFAGLTADNDTRFAAPIQVRAQVDLAEDELIARVTAASQYKSFCSRCLEDVHKDWASTFTLIIDVDSRTEFVELDEDIRQELILNLPVKILCRENCKGLCLECGANLNSGESEHQCASKATMSQSHKVT